MSKEFNLEDLNLNSLISRQKFTININSEANEHPEDARLRRLKEKCLFFFTMGIIIFVLFICFAFLILYPGSKYSGIALNGLISISTGCAGFYLRGKNP